MAKISYVNGRFVPHSKAYVHIDDRGYQFADGIYEVAAFFNNVILDEEAHWKRLKRSLDALQIAMPMDVDALKRTVRKLIEKNGKRHGLLYVQVTRGVAKRDHPFPKDVRPSIVMTVSAAKTPKAQTIADGVGVITRPDIRWGRRDIKSTSLLPNILARQESYVLGLRETWLFDEQGMVSEGSASNAWIVTKNSEIITHPADNKILGGITRDVVLKLARKMKLKVIERPFSLKEIKQAKEAFITSTSANVLPVTRIDDKPVGNGAPGEITCRLLDAYLAHIKAQTGKQL